MMDKTIAKGYKFDFGTGKNASDDVAITEVSKVSECDAMVLRGTVYISTKLMDILTDGAKWYTGTKIGSNKFFSFNEVEADIIDHITYTEQREAEGGAKMSAVNKGVAARNQVIAQYLNMLV